MAKPLARVLALLDILQTGGTRTLHELSDRLGVDERTVRRYVGHLLDLDVPVESVRGRYGGYRLAPGYRMPPLMLTDDEAVAVLLGLVGTRRATLRPDKVKGLIALEPSGFPPAANQAALKMVPTIIVLGDNRAPGSNDATKALTSYVSGLGGDAATYVLPEHGISGMEIPETRSLGTG